MKRSATATRKDKKLKTELLKTGQYLTSVQFTLLGEIAIAEVSKVLNNAGENSRGLGALCKTEFDCFITYFILALMVKGTFF